MLFKGEGGGQEEKKGGRREGSKEGKGTRERVGSETGSYIQQGQQREV